MSGARVTLDQLVKGRDGLDALVRTDPEDRDATAWLATIDFLNREIVRRGGTAYLPPAEAVADVHTAERTREMSRISRGHSTEDQEEVQS